MTTLTPFKIALIQEPPVFLNLEASVVKALNLIETAAGSGARIIIFPETWLPGY
ncbi:MAG: carbon-nitrogen hydrolase family protein, partial [Calditrichaeota bacterium]|nr:carbon-nitrogen hydrolase family protein [Calditrichota bacterium]